MIKKDRFHIDRFLTVSIARPLFEFLPKRSAPAIPILMYHSISDDRQSNLQPYFRTATPPATFRRHMTYLRVSGYSTVTLSEALNLLRSPPMRQSCRDTKGNHPMVVLTFDDGFRDFYTNAFPVLDDLGQKATVFLPSDYIGKSFITGQKCLDEQEIRELAARGIEFGSHTVTHPQLSRLARPRLIRELEDSKARIEDIVGSEIYLFSYPYRFPEEDRPFIRNLRRLLERLGYSAGVTTSIGCARFGDDPFFLARLPINECDDIEFLQAKLDGVYNWMHMAQITYKRLRDAIHRRTSVEGTELP